MMESRQQLSAMRHPIHPACACWPRPSEAKFQLLVADIRARGLLNPMWLDSDGLMLDGKTREEALEVLGIEGRYEVYTGDDPIGFVIAQNERRRHMSEAELAFIGKDLAKLKHGRPSRKDARGHLKSLAEVAEQLGISQRLISNVNTLERDAEPNIIEMARTNKVGIKNATTYALHTPREQQRQATPAEVKREGSKLRTPNKYKAEATAAVTVGNGAERLIAVDTVVKTLRPILREVKEQANRHPATVSFTALRMIGSFFDQILKAWASGDDASVRRISEHFARAEIRRQKGYYHVPTYADDDPSGEQRNEGADA